MRPIRMTGQWGYVFSVGVLLLGAGLRLWGIAQIPPGLHDDEAFHLLSAQSIALGEAFPVYITGNNGNEPLFAYLTAVAYRGLGPGVAWTGRLAAAWAGIIGVALTIRAGKELSAKASVGALAGLALATLFWNIDFSRFGSQPILASAAAAGVMAALGRGLRTRSQWAYVLAGVSLAAGLYAYVIFRLFLIVPLLVGLAVLAACPRQRRELVKGGLIAAGVALSLYAPLGLFFIRHPEWFFNRYSQTATAVVGAAQPVAALWANALKVLGGLFFWGDENWRHNLSGRPALDAAQGLFFLIGCSVCWRRWRRPEYVGMLIWLGAGLLPSLLTAEAPQFGRAIMATPAVALLIALGIATVWKRLQGQLGRSLIIGAVLLSSALTVADYFERWAHDPHLSVAFAVEPARIGRLLHAAAPEAWLYGSRQHSGFWIFEYFLGPAGLARYRTFDGDHCLIAPAVAEHGAVYAINDRTSRPMLQAIYPGGLLLAARERGAFMDVYQVPPGQEAQLSVDIRHPVDFGRQVSLLGYTLPTTSTAPGSVLLLNVIWKSAESRLAGGKIFVHVLGPPRADGATIYSQYDAFPCGDSYPTDQWRVGELIIETYRLTLPTDMPEGDYDLQTGWYTSSNGEAGPRLPAYNETGQLIGDSVPLGIVRVRHP
jgi:hypothetical protein